jgi:hypothetical protein
MNYVDWITRLLSIILYSNDPMFQNGCAFKNHISYYIDYPN